MYVSVCAVVFLSEGVYLCLIVCVSVCETNVCVCVHVASVLMLNHIDRRQ